MPMPRFKIRFPDRHSFAAAHNTSAANDHVTTANVGVSPRRERKLGVNSIPGVDGRTAPVLRVSNSKRNFISVEPSPTAHTELAAKGLDDTLEGLAKEYGGDVVPDFQYASG